MKQVADQHRRAVDYTEGDQVLLNTRYLRFRNWPRKLQRRFVGPFPIKQKIGKAAYKLQLPTTWTIHPVFHTSLLRPWRSSEWSCPVNTPAPDVQVCDEPFYEVDKILTWKKTIVGQCTLKEYLVTWTGYPLERTHNGFQRQIGGIPQSSKHTSSKTNQQKKYLSPKHQALLPS